MLRRVMRQIKRLTSQSTKPSEELAAFIVWDWMLKEYRAGRLDPKQEHVMRAMMSRWHRLRVERKRDQR